MTAAGSGQNSLICSHEISQLIFLVFSISFLSLRFTGLSSRAASEWIARISRRATANGTSVSWLAEGVHSANSFFANVDTTSVGAVLRV